MIILSDGLSDPGNLSSSFSRHWILPLNIIINIIMGDNNSVREAILIEVMV